ncbi:AAA family ATPase [Hazenella coriacea]|uniref:Nuclease SbcCD subunit C n=1 Tax=Hazenella coriacea TaxID=1179467 RepID=A0A4R3L086_9BACL|nr:AAA family ATPase [Hazenella coriacea]TCS92592.1 AAA domain-containing protein [Hazenella coriacea]
MNLFKKLIIENFQSHEHTVIDFSTGLNVFVGPSDSGKSAILRALRWVLFNVPRGTDFIRKGATQCRVSLIFADGTEVIRLRSSSVNRYILRIPDQEEQQFEGFGNTVPQEIIQVHHIEPIQLDQKEIFLHFGTQLESPFLLSESDRNKAKIIGRISGAHLIDNALKKTSADRQQMGMETKQLEQQIANLKEKLEPYAELPKMEEAYLQTEALFAQATHKKEKVNQLKKILIELRVVREEMNHLEQVIQRLQHIPRLEQLLQMLELKKSLYRQMRRLQEKQTLISQEKEICLERIGQSKDLPKVEKLLIQIEAKRSKWNRSHQIHTRWSELTHLQQQLKKMIQSYLEVPRSMEMIQAIQQNANQLQRLSTLHHRWEQQQREKKNLLHLLEQRKDVPQLAIQIPQIEDKWKKWLRLRKINDQRMEIHQRIEIGNQFCRDKTEQIVQLTEEWARLLKKMGKCPTCGSPIHSSVAEHIMEEYRGGIHYAAAGRENQKN